MSYFDVPNDSKYLLEALRAELIERNLVLGLDVVAAKNVDYSAGFFDEDGEEVDIDGFNATEEAFEFFTNDTRLNDYIDRSLSEFREFCDN